MKGNRSRFFCNSRQCVIYYSIAAPWKVIAENCIKCYSKYTAQSPFWFHQSKGSSIYDVHKKSGFWPPSPCPQASTWAGPSSPIPPCGRPWREIHLFNDASISTMICVKWPSTHGRHEIHTVLLKWLVQWPTGPKAEIRLYDSNLFKLYY